MTIANGFIALGVILAAAWGPLILLVLGRNFHGASREERMDRSSRATANALLTGDAASLGAVCRAAFSDADAQVTLAAALEQVSHRLGPARLSALHHQARSTGLAKALACQAHARDPRARGRAALLAASLGLPGACDVAGPLLRDRDPDVQLAAARALRRIGDRRAAECLTEALEQGVIPSRHGDPNWWVRASAGARCEGWASPASQRPAPSPRRAELGAPAIERATNGS